MYRSITYGMDGKELSEVKRGFKTKEKPSEWETIMFRIEMSGARI